MTLQPLEVGEAVALYIESREDELAARTIELQENHLLSFAEWLREEGVHDLNDLRARTVHKYKLHLKKKYASSTVALHLCTVRQFVQFCESIDGVANGVSEKIELPPKDGNARDEKLESDEADEIRRYLRRFHFGSRSHALISILWHCGIRTGTARVLDLSDFDEERERLRI